MILGAISPGELIAFILYATIIAGPMGSFARLYARVQEGIGASKRVFEILDMKGEVRDIPDAKPIPELTGKVEFDNVNFSLPRRSGNNKRHLLFGGAWANCGPGRPKWCGKKHACSTSTPVLRSSRW